MNTTTNQMTLVDDLFVIGDAAERRAAIDFDGACEYSMGSYLAAATAGERVGVGIIDFEEYVANVLYIPDVGLWVFDGMFRSARESYELVTMIAEFIAEELGQPLEELPINLGVFQTVPDIAYDASGVDLDLIVDADELFPDVVDTLTRRAKPLPEGFDLEQMVREILDFGNLFDVKDGFYADWELPYWLHDLVYPVRAAS